MWGWWLKSILWVAATVKEQAYCAKWKFVCGYLVVIWWIKVSRVNKQQRRRRKKKK